MNTELLSMMGKILARIEEHTGKFTPPISSPQETLLAGSAASAIAPLLTTG
jgi:hypothetical protein